MNQTIHNHDHFDHFVTDLALPEESLFLTDVDLWPIYLDSFNDPDERQYHNCSTCKNFIRRFGSLVSINKETGETKSALWSIEPPAEYVDAFKAMKKSVEKATVSGVFLSDDKVLGVPEAGGWSHFAAVNKNIYKRKGILTANQAAAEKKEDFRNISRALSEFNLRSLEQVSELLESDALYRSEKVLGQAKWLYKLKSLTSESKHQLKRKNIIWKAIADAPSGFCHPRSSMIGTLLEDIESGMSFDVAARRFKDKMHPLQYQRPTAAPTAGAIEAAERMVNELGLAKSLERRYATLDDMKTIWTPKEEEVITTGVFDHLKKEARNDLVVAAGNITAFKFLSDVLPKAKKIQVEIPHGRSTFIAFVTALYPDSPCLFQWGNHVSWYQWHGGSLPSEYGLNTGWSDVSAVCFHPFMWEGKNMSHFKNEMSFIIKGARESKNRGNALFPETLKSEFHQVRSVFEAHSRSALIHQCNGEHVVGKGIGSKVRVHTSVITEYVIDRWE